MSDSAYLSPTRTYLLAIATAIVTANAYYIQPIISDVAQQFGVSAARIGLAPALNQLAVAIGIFLMLPLGDRYSNRTLTMIFAFGQCAGLLIMTVSQGFALFAAGSALLGFFTITPYLLPAYATRRVAPNRLGHVTAILTTGMISGILFARVGAGVIAEYFHWRTVYWIASGLMITTTLALPHIMERDRERHASELHYAKLIASIFCLLRTHREIVLSGSIQFIAFGQFIALWLGLALYLTGPEMGFGTDVVGYLAGFALVSVFTTPHWGRLADKIGPRKARVVFAALQVIGVSLLLPFGHNLWLLTFPILVGCIVGPAVDVTTRMTFLAMEPEFRTRLTTIYYVMMFMGGSVGSVAGTAVFDAFGWTGTALYVLGSCIFIMALAILGYRLYGLLDADIHAMNPI